MMKGICDSSGCLRGMGWCHHICAFDLGLDLWGGEERGGWFWKSFSSWIMLDESSCQG